MEFGFPNKTRILEHKITMPREECGDFFVSVYTPMHEVTPKVVAMAVSTVITMFRILLQSSFFIFLKG